MIPIDKGLGMGVGQTEQNGIVNGHYREELLPEENFLGVCNQELLARGTELLKRTRNGREQHDVYSASPYHFFSFNITEYCCLQVIFTGKLFPFTFTDLDR